MLISITNKCRMGCSHCMDDARADSKEYMSFDTFKKALNFNLQYDPSITITGGEPTEHPMFWEFMDYLAETIPFNTIVTITTNGMNLSNADIPKILALNKKSKSAIMWQVSHIKPYYPIDVDLHQNVFKLPNFCIARKLEILSPMGRAGRHNDWHYTSKAPHCFNIRSFVRSTKSFSMSILCLRSRNKFCTPQIAYDGSIKLGESCLCPPASHIELPIASITQDIINFKCSKCNVLLQKLPQNYRNAIGED